MILKKITNSHRTLSYWERKPKSVKKCFILLSPGFAGGEHFKFYANLFPNNFRLIAPNYPGRGETDPLDYPCKSIKEIANDVAFLIKKLKLKKISLWGTSFGTMIINELVTRHDLDIEQIIMITPGEYFQRPRRLLLRSFMYPARSSERTRRLYKIILSKNWSRFKDLPDKNLQSLVEQFFLTANYHVSYQKQVKIPTTFVNAKKDRYVRKRSIDKLRAIYVNRTEIEVNSSHRLNYKIMGNVMDKLF